MSVALSVKCLDLTRGIRPSLLRNAASLTSLKGDAGHQRISYMQPSRCILHHDLAVWSPDDCNTARFECTVSAGRILITVRVRLTHTHMLCGSYPKVEK